MGRLERVLQKADFVSKILYFIAAGALVVLSLTIFSDVMGRFLFNAPITGTDIFSNYLMVCVGFLPLGYGLLRGTHVRMEYFGDLLYKGKKPYVELFVTVVVTVFFAMMTVQIGKRGYADYVGQILKANTNVPWPVWYQSAIGTIGCAMLVIALVMQFIVTIMKIRERRAGQAGNSLGKQGA